MQQSFPERGGDVCERIGVVTAAAEEGRAGFRGLGGTCPAALHKETMTEGMTQPRHRHGHFCTVDEAGTTSTGQKVALQDINKGILFINTLNYFF